MNFELTAEQEELRASVRRFLAERGASAPLGELGLAGLLVPEALGGAGLGMLELGVVLEECGRAQYRGPFVASALGATRLLLGAATPAEQRELLPALASGEQRAAVLGLAPGASLREVGGELSGVERFVLEAGDADWLVVAAGGAVYVTDARARGVRIEPAESLDLTRSLFHVTLDGCPTRRLGGAEAGAAIASAADALSVGLVADGVGAAARALERALEYAKQREQFGRPIGSFQAVQHLLVDMLQDVELARAAAYYALWAQDAAAPAERARASALAKAFASEALPRVGATAIQVFGGIGFTAELDIHLPYRRLVSLSLLYGDLGHHLERLAEFAFEPDERS
jgi:alkylation response protein AidB-like acyl-CoA dehydrogenase